MSSPTEQDAHLAGHPIAIRVGGGRRGSHSHSSQMAKSPNPSKSSTSLEDQTGSPINTFGDYPRPSAPGRQANSGEEDVGIEGERRNREEREEQAPKKEKNRRGNKSDYQTQHNSHDGGRVPRKMNGVNTGGAGSRIQQPARDMAF